MTNPFIDLWNRAVQVKNEVIELANSAQRIGQLILDVLRFGTGKYDPLASYTQGQYCIWNGILCEYVSSTDSVAGSNPKQNPADWSMKLITDKAQVTVNNQLPVAGSVLYALLDAAGKMNPPANASETVRGLARQASADEYKKGLSKDTYVTPNQVKADIATLDGSLQSLNLDKVAKAGNNTNEFIEVNGGFVQKSFERMPTIKGIAVIADRDLTTGDTTLNREKVGFSLPEQLAAILKPLLNATSPNQTVTAGTLADQTITASGDQTYQFPATLFTGADSFTATFQDGASLAGYFSFDGPTRTFTIPGARGNDTYNIRITGTNLASGASQKVDFRFIVNRTTTPGQTDTPFFVSIQHKYDPNNTTDYALFKSSYTGNEASKQPVWRVRRYAGNWFSDFTAAFPTTGSFASDTINAGYKTYMYVNIPNEQKIVVQFKPYADAPDSTIVERVFDKSNGADLGSEIFNNTSPSGKIKAFYEKRYWPGGADKMLCCYADGTGTLYTELTSTGATPNYPNGRKTMTTADGPYASPENFSGTMPYGSLYHNVVNGTYNLTIIDEDGKSKTFGLVISDTGPISTLIAPATPPTNPPTDPTNPPSGGSGGSPTPGDPASFRFGETYTVAN